MAKWSSSKKHLPSEINSGNQYEIKDRLVLEQLNAITENSFYASEKVDTVISDAQDIVNQGKTEIENTTSQGKNELNSIVDDAEDLVAKANASINTVVGTANEALFTVQQVVASKGYYGSNPNLLINGDFRVNQREFATTNKTNTYTVDRWLLSSTHDLASITLNLDNTIRLRNTSTAAKGYFIQYIDPTLNNLWGKTLTMSCKFTDGFILSHTITMPTDKTTTGGVGSGSTKHNLINLRMFIYKKDKMGFTIDIGEGSDSSLEWAKLEIGNVTTAFSPRPYAEELAMCQRYYEKIDTSIEGNNYNIFARVLNSNYLYYSLVNFVVEKRVKPTVKIYSTKNTEGYLLQIGTQDEKGVSANYITTKTFSISIKNNDAVANSVLGGYFEADAEIY